MLFQLPASALLLSLLVLVDASSHSHGAHLANMRRRQLNPRGPQSAPPVPRASLNRRTCKKQAASSSSAQSVASAPATIANVGADPSTSTTKKAATPTTSSSKAVSHTTSSETTASSPTSGGVAAGNFVPTKPSDWPTATQAGPSPTSTVASASDPYLEELSKAIDNSGNSQFTAVHTGDMTYYGQGLGACGDVYDDNSFTAAVSHLMFDSWAGSDSSAQNRNPICGPFVPGRTALDSAGTFFSAVKSTIGGYAEIGGDGLINCVGTADVQCHVPLTATVTHGETSIQVKIVDRCAACAEGDIDLTPAAFAALANPALGRTSVTWQFNNW
ncbi:hypothetical protein B0H11DRAFT_1927556 [Mycena galericulata]|nr:hypothetical protein B0H11DRAFT_1927556 [Mycena galericulata]